SLVVLLYAVFAGYVISTIPQFPEIVATHFSAGGHADGWMVRASFIRFSLIFGMAMPVFLVTIFWLVRFLPPSAVNLPNRDYWLAPGQRASTNAKLMRHSIWLACLTVALTTGLHYMILAANSA